MPTRVLFVDDDPAVLFRLEQSFRPPLSEWDVRFEQGGPAALASLALNPADVIVTDVLMPGMDGVVLLGEIRRRYPEIVRIALVGSGDVGMLHRLVPVAHRILAKPCEEMSLRLAIARVTSLRSTLGRPDLARAVGQAKSLPSMPAIYAELADALQQPDCSPVKVAQIIGRDLGLAAKLLQLANSAAFGTRIHVVDLVDAVRRMGTVMTRNLLLATAVFSRFDPAKIAPFSMDTLWNHSLAVCDRSRKLATEMGLSGSSIAEAAIGGLMHDVGRLVLASLDPAEYRTVLARVESEGCPLVQAERERFGFCHADIGGYVLELWGLPAAVVEAVAWHHTPDDEPEVGFTPVTAVHLAEALLAPDEAGVSEAVLERLDLHERFARWAGECDGAAAPIPAATAV